MTAPQLPPGHVVAGKYSIVGVLGYGGTAATYRAAGADARAFAVKIFDPALAQRSDVMASLEQVYGASNALPGTDAARIVDAGYDAQTGAPFSVTELLPHPSLAELVAQRPIPMSEIGPIVQSIGRVLDEAHGRQLIHLALKPTNVFVSSAPGRPVTLTDFGAAYARGAVPSQEGHALSAPWMAPEQLRQGVPIGPAADVFSLALLVFHMLTGRSYWLSCASGAPDFSALAREIVAPRTPVSMRATELGAAMPATLDVVLARGLAVDPGERYRSAGELAAAIAAMASGGRADSATAVLDTSALGGPPDLGGGGSPADALGSTMAIPEGMGMGMFPPPGPAPSPYGAPAPGPAAGSPPPAAGGFGGGAPQPDPGGFGAPAPAPQGLGGGAGPGPGLGAPAMPAPGPGAFGEPSAAPPPPQQSKALPIILAAGILVLLGGIAAFLLAGRRARQDDAGPIEVSAPSAEAVASAAPTGEPAASAAPAADSAAPAAESAAPAASAAPSTDAEVALSCTPDCEEISIDGKKLDDPSKPTTLAAGTHKVTVGKTGFVSQTDTIKVEAGKRLEKQYKLVAKPSAPAGPAKTPTGPQKNCGKFLKRCN